MIQKDDRLDRLEAAIKHIKNSENPSAAEFYALLILGHKCQNHSSGIEPIEIIRAIERAIE